MSYTQVPGPGGARYGEKLEARTIEKLAAEYKFDVEEAKRFMRGDYVEDPKTPTKSKSKGKKKEPDAPKKSRGTNCIRWFPKKSRETNGYHCYLNDQGNRDRIYQMLNDGDEVNGEYDNSPQAQLKALQAEWKELSEEEKQHWKDKATHMNSASGSE